MKRALVVLPLLMGAVTPPPTWREDKAAGAQLAAKTQAELDAKLPTAATVQVFVAPDNSVLYVTLVAHKLTQDRDAHAREIVDSFMSAPQRAQLTSTKVSVTAASSKLDAAARQIEAELQWQDDDTSVQTRSRLLIAADAEHLITITGECVMTATTPQTLRDGCTAALATLDLELPAARRVALALAPEGTEPPSPDPAPRPGAAQPTMSDGDRAPVPPITLPGGEPARGVDRRPVYVGLGLVVLAGLFWWNRRRRDRASEKGTDE